jgi:hypothetical protein
MLCKGKSMKIGGVIEDLIRYIFGETLMKLRKIIDEFKEEESVS